MSGVALAEPLVAGSVCEAQKLKARNAADPRIEIEIPAEFDKPFPSLAACDSHDAAWDENNEGRPEKHHGDDDDDAHEKHKKDKKDKKDKSKKQKD